MKYFILVFLGILIALIQLSFAFFFSFRNISLNFVFIFALYFLIKNQYLKALTLALAGGLILDFVSFSSFGAHFISLIFAIFIISLFTRFFPLERQIFKTLFIGLAILLNYFLFNIIYYILNQKINFVFQSAFLELIYNFLGALIIFYLFGHWSKRKTH